MKGFRKSVALLLGIALIFGMLSTVSAAEPDLRGVVVGQAEAIANVPWTLEERVAKASITGSRLEKFNATGIFPTTYFEYRRLLFPLRGVMVESNSGSLEKFKSMMDPTATKVEGYGHIPAQNYYGMNIDSFLTDVISRVSPVPVTSLRQALTSDALQALMSGADLSATSSKAAIGSKTSDALAAYGKLQRGDLLLAWDDRADVSVDPTIHAMVVKDVNAAKGEVTVIYPSFNLVLWHFVCDTCGATDIEGPTSAALPGHTITTSSYTLGRYLKHYETANTSCGGTWQPDYGSTWRTDTVTFDQLLGKDGQKVADASSGYLPYTLKAYSNSAVAPVQVSAVTDVTPKNIAGGLDATITSNYRIVSFDATLTKKGGESQHFISTADWDSWTYKYSDPALNLALLECELGDYNLKLDVYSGPVTDAKSLEVPCTTVFSMDFTLSDSQAKLSINESSAHQGEQVTANITPTIDGVTAMRTTMRYDTDFFVFDEAATKAANPKATVVDNGDGSLTATYYGEAIRSGATAIKPIFRVKRTGYLPKAASEVGAFYLTTLSIATKSGAGEADLVPSRPDTTPISVATGMNTVIYKNYAQGLDLILAFMYTDTAVINTTNTTIPMSYNGEAMYDVTSSHYKVDGEGFLRIYAYLVRNANSDLVRSFSGTCQYVEYSEDVNQSGWVDINDAQAIANICSGKMALNGNETKWLLADINRDGKVDTNDQLALMSQLVK